MTHRKIISIVLFLFAASLFAQKVAIGVQHVTKPNDGSYTVVFSPTPVGQTNVNDGACFYECFFVTDVQHCDYSGTIELVKNPAPPFATLNLRKSTISAASCTGTPVSLPVTLQTGEILLEDFTFTPTRLGTFQDTIIHNLTPTGSPTSVFTWILQGSTPSTPPNISSFAAVPSSITPGQPVTLSWATNATSVTIDNGVGPQPSSGSVTVNPSSTTTYTLTATNSSGNSTATTTVNVINTPSLAINSLPSAMLQLANAGGATTTFTVANSGGGPTNVSITKNGSFFTLSPASFSLAARASQVVSVTATSQATGEYDGSATVTGSGVPAALSVPIKLLVTPPPDGPVKATPTNNRVDTSQSTSGTVSFTNSGPCPCTLTGTVSSDVPWLIPQSGVISIPFGASVPVGFTIDRTKRSESDTGSTTGSLSLAYFTTPLAKTGLAVAPVPSVTLVAVVDTPPLTVGSDGPPPLTPGEVALFVPSVGHVIGGGGTLFISDLSVLNPPGNPQINDIRLFYSGPGGTQKSTSLPPVGNVSVALADVVKNVFATEGQVGSLQIRSASAAKLAVSTNIFNASNPAGTYGTAIPTLRSDRGVASGDRLVLTGIVQNAAARTNIFIQETAGVGATVQAEFLDQNGTTLATRPPDTLAPFALLQIRSQDVPAGTVVAVLRNVSAGNGTFLAYATPIDNISGDDWSVADWSRIYGYSGSDPVVIPVAGVAPGANNSLFRTDVTITNTGTSTASGTLQYFPAGGTPQTRTITLGARQSTILNDVIGTYFGFGNAVSVGYLSFTPSTGSFVITNRTYTASPSSPGTYGSATPVLPMNGLLTLGSLRAIGSLQDAVPGSTTPVTFRTNAGLVETSGNPATVRVTLKFNYPAGQKLQAVGSAFKDYALAPHEYRPLNRIASEILGASRNTLGDLRGLELDFQVIGGTGSVAVYTSSVDNGTNDSILRTE